MITQTTSGIRCGNHSTALGRVYHETTAEVRACFNQQTATVFSQQDERDMQRLEAEGDRAETRRDEAAKYAETSAAIQERTTRIAPTAVEAEGLYRLGDVLYQVVRGKDSGRLYAKHVQFTGDKKRPILTYAPGVIFKLTPADLVPADEAEELTRKTGWCVFGHFLTNPKSIARGMGPVCWARYGSTR